MSALSRKARTEARFATHEAGQRFAEIVLKAVAGEREQQMASAKAAAVVAGTAIDRSAVRLMTISGKGGWHPNPKLTALFAQSTNVALLDHLVSVARGAAVFAALSMAGLRDADGQPVSTEELEAYAALGFALGFMHDANKAMIDAPADLAAMTAQDFAELAQRYRVDDYLSQAGWRAADGPTFGAMLRQLAMASEANQNDEGIHAAARAWCAAGTPEGSLATPKGVAHVAARCVRWADRLDGNWLKAGLDEGPDVIRETLDGFRATAQPEIVRALGEWTAITVIDPQLPFLLDALLAEVERACEVATGMVPLFATHFDGRLVAVLPQEDAPDIWEQAVKNTLDELPFALDLKLNNRKGLALVGDRPTWNKLVAHWRQAVNGEDGALGDPRTAQLFMEIHTNAAAPNVWATLDALWNGAMGRAALGQGPVIAPPSGPVAGKYVPLVPRARLEALFAAAQQGNAAAWEQVWAPLLALVCVLALPDEKGTAELGTPLTAAQRQAQVRAAVAATGITVPSLPWDHSDAFTRAGLTAFWAVGEALVAQQGQHPTLSLATVWQVGRTLMDGDPQVPGVPGLAPFFPPAWQDQAKQELQARWTAMATGRAVDGSAGTSGKATHARGKRCLFLDVPVPDDSEPIGTEFGLYGVKASAFSGRSGRADHLMSAPRAGDNYISGPARLEHALRQSVFRTLRGKSGGVALTVSAPTRQGLFARLQRGAGLEQAADAPQDLASFDLLRAERRPGQRVVTGEALVLEHSWPRGGIRLGRYEDFPSRLADQVDFLLRWAETARRFGRPVHLFRGLARPTRAFFAFDALPSVLAAWLQGREWRLEQMPDLILRLKLAQWVLDKEAGGPGEPWLQRLTAPDTAWMAAAALLSCHKPGNRDKPVPPILVDLLSSLEMTMANQPHAALMHELAAANFAFQRMKQSFRQLSNSERTRAWNIAYDGWERHQAESLDCVLPAEDFIAGRIQAELGRKGALVGLDGASPSRAAGEAIERFAALFVQLARRHIRSADLRSPLTSAYVYCFEKANQRHWEAVRARKAAEREATPEGAAVEA